jgi:hypothetical protein
LTPIGDDAQGVDIETRIGLIENREVGSSTAICRISLRFFSPPENPSLTERFNERVIHVDRLHLVFEQAQKIHGVDGIEAAVLANCVQAVRKK